MTTPRGDLLGRLAAKTYWISSDVRGEDDDLLQVIESYMTLVEERSSFISGFIETGGSVELYVSWYSSRRSGGTTISSDLLGRMSALGIDLSLDVYSA